MESRGGNLLAMGFPLFALLAVMAIGGLVVAVLAHALRLRGAPFGVGCDWGGAASCSTPVRSWLWSCSAGLAAGCFTVASALRPAPSANSPTKRWCTSGADCRSTCFDPVEIPAGLGGRATDDLEDRRCVTATPAGRLVGDVTQVTADVATLRADGASESLDSWLWRSLGAGAGKVGTR